MLPSEGCSGQEFKIRLISWINNLAAFLQECCQLLAVCHHALGLMLTGTPHGFAVPGVLKCAGSLLMAFP
jgi:hypothetical protein